MTAETTAITWWAVLSAFGGTVIGGGISFLLARMSLKAAKKQRDDDRTELQRARAYALLFKMVRIYSDFTTMERIIQGALDEARKRGLEASPWQGVQPIAPLPDAVKFAAEEMALVLSLDGEIFNKMAPLDVLHKSTIALFELYNTRREHVTSKLAAEMKEGNLGVVEVPAAQKKWLDPQVYMLNALIASMAQRATRDREEVRASLENLSKLFNERLGLKHRFEQ